MQNLDLLYFRQKFVYKQLKEAIKTWKKFLSQARSQTKLLYLPQYKIPNATFGKIGPQT